MLVDVGKKLIRDWKMHRNPVSYARGLGVQIGADCRLLGLTPATFGSEPYLVRLGNHVTVTSGVRFVTHDGGVWVFREKIPEIDVFGPVRVGNNVFIGLNSILLPGVTVGNNVIIGAGSVVNRDVPDNSVVAGVPAKIIKNVDAYWTGVAGKAVYIRSRTDSEKRVFLEQQFGHETISQ